LITLSRNRPKRGSVCHRCQIIRMFIVIAVAVSIFAIVVDESARYLQLVTPGRAAAAIWIGGGVLFLLKLGAWYLARRR